jgi:hypothetical protein
MVAEGRVARTRPVLAVGRGCRASRSSRGETALGIGPPGVESVGVQYIQYGAAVLSV